MGTTYPPVERTERPTGLVAAEQSNERALDAHAIRPIEPGLVSRIGCFQRDGIATPAQPLQRRFVIVDQRNHDVARVRAVYPADDHSIAIEDAGVDHRIAGHFQRIMLTASEKRHRYRYFIAAVLERFDRRTCRDPSHDGNRHDAVALVAP